MSAMQAVEDRELLCFIERLRWRDSQQGQIMCAVREAIEGGDYGRIPALMDALDATHREDAEEHEAVEREATCTREHLSRIARDLDPLAARLEDGRCRGGIARVTTLLEAGS